MAGVGPDPQFGAEQQCVCYRGAAVTPGAASEWANLTHCGRRPNGFLRANLKLCTIHMVGHFSHAEFGGTHGLLRDWQILLQQWLASQLRRRANDDFGHARRNELEVGGRMELINGGTLEIDSPRPYSVVAARLLRELGVDPVKLDPACTQICKKIDAGAPISGNSYCREIVCFSLSFSRFGIFHGRPIKIANRSRAKS
jgi:hypothetical protein